MNDQIDDLMILGFSFTQQQLEDLRAAIDIALSTFDNSLVDSNKALTNRLHTIRERIEKMIERKQSYKQGGEIIE
jgi:hypothetical protein